ncbi:MAG: tetratricopeptide repeat protein [Candidatus Korobacteraceae bacterium]
MRNLGQDQALEQFHTALSLDLLSLVINTNYAVMLRMARRYPDALAQFQKVLAQDPNFVPALNKLSQLYATTGHFAEAVSEAQTMFPKPISVSADAKGDRDLIMRTEWSDRATPVAIASAIVGDRDQAFQYLGQAYPDGDYELLTAIRLPALDPLRSDPRFADLMHRLRRKYSNDLDDLIFRIAESRITIKGALCFAPPGCTFAEQESISKCLSEIVVEARKTRERYRIFGDFFLKKGEKSKRLSGNEKRKERALVLSKLTAEAC